MSSRPRIRTSIRFDDNLERMSFTVENRDPQPQRPHAMQMTISGLPSTHEVIVDGKTLSRLAAEGGTVVLPIGKGGTSVSLVRAR